MLLTFTNPEGGDAISPRNQEKARECWRWTVALRQDESCALEYITVSQGSGCQRWIAGGLWPPFGKVLG